MARLRRRNRLLPTSVDFATQRPRYGRAENTAIPGAENNPAYPT